MNAGVASERRATAPVITAVVCTHNRSAYLRKALASLREQSIGNDSYEVLVVDNCSTDDTKQVFDREAGANFTYIFEAQLGLSTSRNTGWKRARGEYVAYLDDDAVASSVWLEQIVQAFEVVQPRPGGVGGRITPIWEAPRPSWLSDRIALALTILDWSDAPMFIGDHQWLAGANLAYPRELLVETGGFDAMLGRSGTNLISCEESMLNDQIKGLGYRLFYQPEAAVEHHIAASRLTKEWHIRRQYWNGVSGAVALRLQTSPTFVARLRLAWQAVVSDATGQLLKLCLSWRRPEDERFELRCLAGYNLGYGMGLISPTPNRMSPDSPG